MSDMHNQAHEIRDFTEEELGTVPASRSPLPSEEAIQRAFQRLEGMRTACSTLQDVAKIVQAAYAVDFPHAGAAPLDWRGTS